MIPIILLSSSRCEKLVGAVTLALGGRERVTVDRESVIEQGGEDFLLCLRRRMPSVEGKGAAILRSWQGRAELPPGTVVTALSHNRRARRLLRQTGCEAVCCGMSSADSVTLSSITDDSAVVTVQRRITDIAGGTVEPCDLPVRLSQPLCPDDLMLSCAAALICGVTPKNI